MLDLSFFCGIFPFQPKQITWCPSRVFPPVRACMFSSHLTSVTFLADPSAGGGLPRGTFIYATSPVPVQVTILEQHYTVRNAFPCLQTSFMKLFFSLIWLFK